MAASPTTFRSTRSMLAGQRSCCLRDAIVSCHEIRHVCTCSHLRLFRCQHGTTRTPTDCRQRSISGGGTGSDSRRALHDNNLPNTDNEASNNGGVLTINPEQNGMAEGGG